MADELTIRGKVPATQSSGELATRAGGAHERTIITGTHKPDEPGELEVCTILVQQRGGGRSAAIPEDRQPTKEARFCQVMANGDSTAILVGLGFSRLATYRPASNPPEPWQGEAKKLGKIIDSMSVYIPRPVAQRAVLAPKVHLYMLAASSLSKAYASYVPARSPEQAIKLWTLGKNGVPPDVLRGRIMVLPMAQSKLTFLLGLPTLINWEHTREQLSTERGSLALR